MYVRDFTIHKSTDEHVSTISHRPCQAKDLVAKRMTPPATCYFRTGHGIGEVRYRSARALEDHAVPPYKLNRLVGRHIALTVAYLSVFRELSWTMVRASIATML